MQDYLLYNGSFYKDDQPLVTADNRGLRYGDGLFETIKVKDKKIYFGGWHCERLFQGMQLLGFEPPAYFTPGYLLSQVNELCKKNNHLNARVRVNIIRGNGSLYDPESHFPNCIIQSWPLPESKYHLNEDGLVTGIYLDAKKSIDSFSNLKSNNYLPYLMAALYAKKHQWNDALLLNSEGNICDATIANIFIVKNGIVLTPPLTDGCIAGIMRRYLAENLAQQGFEFREETISVEDLLNAEEVFLSNTIRGIRRVQSCKNSTYGTKLGTAIYTRLLKNME
jgi:branched-chain amino acid aminotransferase